MFNKFRGTDFIYNHSFSKLQLRKRANEAFSVPNLTFFLIFYLFIIFLHKPLHFDKSEVTDFKYDNSLSKLHAKNTLTRHVYSQIQGFLFLHKVWHSECFVSADFK